MGQVKILDLFCGAGGAARGYDIPGADITGVDIRPQPRYPYRFIQADALTFPLDGYDLIHASPPCQGHSTLRAYPHDYTRPMLRQTLKRLREAKPRAWVVENVPGGDVNGWRVTLCGSALGRITQDGSQLFLARHRRIWTNVPLPQMECQCGWYRAQGWHCAGVYGTSRGNGPGWKAQKPNLAQAQELMGVYWMTWTELSEAVPPSYTQWIMNQIVEVIG